MSATSKTGKFVRFVLEVARQGERPKRAVAESMLTHLPDRDDIASYCRRHGQKLQDEFGVSAISDDLYEQFYATSKAKGWLARFSNEQRQTFHGLCFGPGGGRKASAQRDRSRPRPRLAGSLRVAPGSHVGS